MDTSEDPHTTILDDLVSHPIDALEIAQRDVNMPSDRCTIFRSHDTQSDKYSPCNPLVDGLVHFLKTTLANFLLAHDNFAF
jgi:hypothetical protein